MWHHTHQRSVRYATGDSVGKYLPSSRGHAVLGETLVSDTATLPKSIDREGLGESRTGTWQEIHA